MIINPMTIYLIGIIDGIKHFMFLLTVLTVVLMIITLVTACSYSDDNNLKGLEKYKKFFIKLSICFVMLMAANVLTPNKNTMIAMVSTQYITTENIKLGKDVVIDTIKEVITIINKEEK